MPLHPLGTMYALIDSPSRHSDSSALLIRSPSSSNYRVPVASWGGDLLAVAIQAASWAGGRSFRRQSAGSGDRAIRGDCLRARRVCGARNTGTVFLAKGQVLRYDNVRLQDPAPVVSRRAVDDREDVRARCQPYKMCRYILP